MVGTDDETFDAFLQDVADSPLNCSAVDLDSDCDENITNYIDFSVGPVIPWRDLRFFDNMNLGFGYNDMSWWDPPRHEFDEYEFITVRTFRMNLDVEVTSEYRDLPETESSSIISKTMLLGTIFSLLLQLTVRSLAPDLSRVNG